MKTKHFKCTDIVDQVHYKHGDLYGYNFLSSLFYLSKYCINYTNPFSCLIIMSHIAKWVWADCSTPTAHTFPKGWGIWVKSYWLYMRLRWWHIMHQVSFDFWLLLCVNKSEQIQSILPLVTAWTDCSLIFTFPIYLTAPAMQVWREKNKTKETKSKPTQGNCWPHTLPWD